MSHYENDWDAWFDSLEILDNAKSIVMRIVDPYERSPGFAFLREILLRPFSVAPKYVDATMLLSLSKFWNSSPSRECLEIFIFHLLLDKMTREQKARDSDYLVDILKNLRARHRSAKSCKCPSTMRNTYALTFATLRVERLRRVAEQDISGEVVDCVIQTIGRIHGSLSKLLLGMDPNALDFLLNSFSDEKFHACDIRKKHCLMEHLSNIFILNDDRMGAIFIRHGFKYSFHFRYYSTMEWKLLYRCTIQSSSPIINPRAFDHPHRTGNLRKQMAAEILVHLLCGKFGMKKEVLCLLWDSLPYPFITPDELYDLMEEFFHQPFILSQACAEYREHFPWVPSAKQPRDLKHLARVGIRESMVRAHSTGERAVRSLGLPRSIENYLLLVQ